jgi:hypothetical protein
MGENFWKRLVMEIFTDAFFRATEEILDFKDNGEVKDQW